MHPPGDYSALYVAFDPHPSSKGASTHITHMYQALRGYMPKSALLTLEGVPDAEPDFPEDYYAFQSDEPNYLRRGQEFTRWVGEFMDQQPGLQVAHFRDIWGGMAVVARPHVRAIFEVNGVPSIELPYRYPHIGPTTLDKLRKLEDYCLERAQALITPSETIKTHLLSRGVAEELITVIPNGADLHEPQDFPEGLPPQYFLYQGALQPWQGLDVLLKALRYLEDLPEVPLVICSAHKERHAKRLHKLAEKLGVADRIVWRYQVAKPALHQLMEHAVCTVAPLTECSRNLEQGCSPLKVLESMACGTPVVASDLPVVREIVTPEVDGMLCRPGRPADLARALRVMYEFPELRDRLGKAARHTIASRYTWEQQTNKVIEVYRSPIEEFFDA